MRQEGMPPTTLSKFQGKTVKKALKNLREAIELYLEDEDAEVPKEAPLLTIIEVSLKKRYLRIRVFYTQLTYVCRLVSIRSFLFVELICDSIFSKCRDS